MATKKDESKEDKRRKREEEFYRLAEMALTRYRPESLDSICQSTKFNRREVQIMYRGFKQECPTGIVNEDTFKRVYGTFFPQGDACGYAHFVFRALDKANHGCLTFEEFIKALSDLSYGSVDDKLRWTFDLYDQDGDGVITRPELESLIGSIYEMMGSNTDPPVSAHTIQTRVNNILSEAGDSHSSAGPGITYDAFVKLCIKDKQHSTPFHEFATDLRLRN